MRHHQKCGRAHFSAPPSGRVENRAVYVALGVDMEGRKDVLGLWTSSNEGAKFWLGVLTELKNRGCATS
jgi:putative transposase